MKIVLDESVPRDLAKALHARGCDVAPFPTAWKGTKNGRLLARVAESGYDVLLTCDKNMPHQQNIERLEVLIAVLPVQILALLLPQAEAIARFLSALTMPAAGVVHISIDQPEKGE